MNIFIEAYHTFCEWYMFNTLPLHTFHRVSDSNTPWAMRRKPDNLILYNNIYAIPWDSIDIAYVVSPNMYNIAREKVKACIFHVDQMPPSEEFAESWRNVISKKTITMYWSKEEAEAWNMGTPCIHRHPIDCNFWKGYKRTIPHAITVATRPISSWGNLVKGYSILKQAYQCVPIQVVAGGDPEFPLSSPMIETEEEMRDILASHSVYFNCGWKLDRTSLEAMAIGLPVVAIKTPQNVYKDIFTNGEDIIYCNNTEEMIEKTLWLIKDGYMAMTIGKNARMMVSRHFRPITARIQWENAFNLSLEG